MEPRGVEFGVQGLLAQHGPVALCSGKLHEAHALEQGGGAQRQSGQRSRQQSS